MIKRQLLGSGDIFAENDILKLKLMEPKYKADFVRTMEPITWTQNKEVIEAINEETWNDLNSERNITFAILDSRNEAYMGYCQYKNIITQKPDIGIELLPEYRSKGVGYGACSLLLDKWFSETDAEAMYYKVKRKNTISIALVGKLGGKIDCVDRALESYVRTYINVSLLGKEKAEQNAASYIEWLLDKEPELAADEHEEDVLIYKIAREDRNKEYN